MNTSLVWHTSEKGYVCPTASMEDFFRLLSWCTCKCLSICDVRTCNLGGAVHHEFSTACKHESQQTGGYVTRKICNQDYRVTGNRLVRVHRPTFFDLCFLTASISETIMYIFFRQGVAARREPPNGEVDRQWKDSNPRTTSWNSVTLSTWLAPLF